MATYTYKGNQIGEALQFDGNGLTTTVEIGRVWFAATDTVTIVTSPGTTDAAGNFIGGAGAILSLTVTTADGRVTTFGAATNPLDVDPDQSKLGADFFYISESPTPGTGGAYAGLQLEKIVVADVPLTASGFVTLTPGGAYVAPGGTGGGNPTVPGGGTPDNDVLTGTATADSIDGGLGNDFISGLGGNDTLRGGDGNEVMQGGAGADRLFGDAGDDRLIGGNGADRLNGGFGNDLMDGGAGADTMAGGAGGDTFVFGAGDRVVDFSRVEGDEIAFNAALGIGFGDISISQNAQGTVISYAGGSMLLAGYFGGFDPGNDFKFDYVPSTDFL